MTHVKTAFHFVKGKAPQLTAYRVEFSISGLPNYYGVSIYKDGQFSDSFTSDSAPNPDNAELHLRNKFPNDFKPQ